MKLSVHGRRVLATVSALVLLAAMIPLSTLTLSALQTKEGREDLLAEHGGFDSADDFGTGKFWYPEGNNTAEAERSETEGQNGSGALKLTRDGSGQAFVYATISVTPGEEYTLTYYKKTTARLVSYITVRDNGSTAIERQDAAMNEYADWTRMTLSFTAPTSGKIRIDIGLNAGTGSALFDSFSLVSRTETTGSYLFNGDFEQANAKANWNGITGDDLAAIDATGGLDGSAALKIKNGGATVYSNKIDVTPDTAYTFSLWRKKDAPVQAYVQVFEFDAAGNLLGAPSTGRNYLTGTGTASDWQQYTFTHTMQSKTASMRLQILANAGSGAAWFDDITVTTSFKATEIPASALTLSESKAENGVSTFTFAVNGVTLPQSETALVNADPLQKLVTKDYRYLFGATVDTADRTDLKLIGSGDSLMLQFADNDQSVYAVQKNAKKIVLPAETTFLDPTDVAKGYRLTEAVILYRNADGWSTTCKHSYDSYHSVSDASNPLGVSKFVCSLCGYEDTKPLEAAPTAKGASIRTEGVQGLRFGAELKKITPADGYALTGYGIVLLAEEKYTGGELVKGTPGAVYSEGGLVGDETDAESLTFDVTVVNFKPSQYDKNIMARAYAVYSDGENEVLVYADYDGLPGSDEESGAFVCSIRSIADAAGIEL